MKAVFLLSTLSIGGSERKAVRLANALSEAGYSILVVYFNEPDDLLSELNERVPRHCLQRVGKFSFPALARLFSIINRFEPNVIVCFNLYPLLYVVLVKVVRRFRIVTSVNTTDFSTNWERWQMILYRPVLKLADRIVFGSQDQANSWICRYRLNAQRCVVIYNGIESAQFAELSRPQRHSEPVILGTIGQLRSEKNHQQLIEATTRLLKRGHCVRAVIVGEGREREQLLALINELGLGDAVDLVGQVNDVKPFLGEFDVFVLTSLSETFSNAALEAMAAGLPVVSSNTGGMSEMVQDRHNGLLFPVGNTDELVATLETVVIDQSLRYSLGASARLTVEARFTFAEMLSAYEELIFPEIP